MQCAICISNKSEYLKNEERYGKTIDGVPLSFQELFQDKLNSHFIYTLRNDLYIFHLVCCLDVSYETNDIFNLAFA